MVGRISGAAAPQVERVEGLPQINIEYDRLRTATYGLSIAEVNRIVSTAFAGGKAGSIYEGERRFDLVVRLDTAQRTSIEDVRNLLVPLPGGVQIPLSQLAAIDFKTGPAQISREAGRRRIVVGFNVRGRDVESVVEDIQAALAKDVKLPVGYAYTYGGAFENLKKASGRLQLAVPLSLALIFMLLYFTFGSVRQAALIFTAIPMSAIGGVAALALRGLPFSISAGIGFIALFGVAVLNGIVLMGTFNQLEREGRKDPFARVVEGAKIRLRPVLMTATVASLGFLPMALSTSAGAEVQRPLATVVIGGLITATLLTLFVLPGLYLLFGQRKEKERPVPTIVAALLLSFFALPAGAQTRVLTVEEAVQEALQNNGLVQSRNLEVQAAQQLRRTAGELPRLELGAQAGQYNSIHTDFAGSVQQTLPAPGLFKARRRLLDAQLAGRQLQRTATEWEIRTAVQQAAAQIAYLESSRQRLSALDSLYGEAVRVARVRYNAGDVAQLEIATAQVKQGEIHLLLLGAEADAETSYNTLKALLNRPDSFVLAVDTPFRPLLLLQLPEKNAVAQNPAILSLYQTALITAQTGGVERALALPAFTLGYHNQSLIGFQNTSGTETYFGGGKRFQFGSIGLSLPLTYGAARARIQALETTRQAALATARYEEAQLTARLQTALVQYRRQVAQFNYYQQQALPNARALVTAAQLGYRTGATGYVEYLFALQTATDIEIRYGESVRQLTETVLGIYAIIRP